MPRFQFEGKTDVWISQVRRVKQEVGVTVALKLFLNATKSVEKSTIGANGSTLVDLKWQIRCVPNIEQLKWDKGKNKIGGLFILKCTAIQNRVEQRNFDVNLIGKMSHITLHCWDFYYLG